MKAYEFPSKLNAEGNLEIPETVLRELSTEQNLKIIVLIADPSDSLTANDDISFSAESFRESWRQANNGQTLPLSQLWEGIDVD